MTKRQSPHSSDRALQIVSSGYWTFWCVFSLLGGIGGVVTAFVSKMEDKVVVGVISVAWSIAWAVVYWRIRRETKAA